MKEGDMGGSNRQIVFLFSEVNGLGKDVLGGKGRGLVEMTKAGFPIPPGMVVVTGVSRASSQEGRLPNRFTWQLQRGVALVERQTGKRFGDPRRPLLFSVRSGAKVSMPGMMDTVLNLGLNEQTLMGLIEEAGEHFAWDTYRRFLSQFGSTVLGISSEVFESVLMQTKLSAKVESDSALWAFQLQEVCRQYRQIIEEQTGQPMVDDPWKQLIMAVLTVVQSWSSERAVAYRKVNAIPDSWGTAVVIQAMVFGNAGYDSGTGVVFSRNVATGEPGLYGEFLPMAQGEDVVAGVRTPQAIAELASENPALYQELEGLVRKLELHYNDVVDVEFTVEEGRLYLLQCRVAKRTPVAAVRIAMDMVSEGRLTQEKAVARVGEDALEILERPKFDPEALKLAVSERFFACGLAASNGAAVGQIVFMPGKAKLLADSDHPVILVREETSPNDFVGMLASSAIVTARGGKTSHAAVVARAMGKPAVVGVQGLLLTFGGMRVNGQFLKEGEIISVDGNTGRIFRGEIPLVEQDHDEKVKTFLSWVETHRVRTQVNISLVSGNWCVNTILNDFYLIDSLAQELMGTVLEQEAQIIKRTVQREAASVLATYLLVAVIGETRHAWRESTALMSLPTILDSLVKLGLKEGCNRRDTQTALLQKLSPEKVREFVSLAVQIFEKARWSSSFGGQSWAEIAKTLLSYLHGELKVAAFVDRVFDLRHNGGRLFDKHSMVSMTNESVLSLQLDTKRSVNDLEELYPKLRSIHYEVSPVVNILFEKWRLKRK